MRSLRPKADTQAIAVFVCVVESKGFTSAAKALELTPSGASRIVSRLEQDLGVRLLRRTTRSLSLTDHGAAFYDRCAQVLAELAEAESAVGESAHSPRGRLRIDAPTLIGERLIMPTIPGSRSAFQMSRSI